MIVAAVQDPELVDAVGEVDGVEVVVWPAGADLPARADEVELLVPDYIRAPEDRPDAGRAAAPARRPAADGGVRRGASTSCRPGSTCSARAAYTTTRPRSWRSGSTIASLRGIDVAVREHGHWRQDVERRSLADSDVAVARATAPSAVRSPSGCWPAAPA